MQRPFFIALGLGLVSAVVFISAVARPNALGILLFIVTALPLFLAALGWGWRAGLVAGIVSSSAVGLVGGPIVALSFALTQAVPAFLLGYLALLQRETEPSDGTSPAIEWYPPGGLLFWSVVVASVLTPLILLAQGDGEWKAKLKSAFETQIKTTLPPVDGAPALDPKQISDLADVFVQLLPAGLAVSILITLLLNLWLAGRITLASGQLDRPWPRLDETAMPRGSSLLLLAALIVGGIEGAPGVAGLAVSGALFIAFTLTGLAVIHFKTRGKPWRPFALAAIYAAALLVVLPGINVPVLLILTLLGVADSVFDFRGLRLGPPGPPPVNPAPQ